MASSKLFIAFVFISLSLLHIAEADEKASKPNANGADQGSLLKKIDCGAACSARCRLSSRPHLCKRACGTCCKRCNCVPPGTSGNQELCPCYASLTTHGGRRKCP